MMDKKIVNQTVNIGPDEEFITINQLFELLSNKLKFNQKPEYYEDRPNELSMQYVQLTKREIFLVMKLIS